MVKISFVIILVLSLKCVAGQLNLTNVLVNIGTFRKQNVTTVRRIPQMDAIGNIVTLIDMFLTEATKRSPPPKGNSCDTRIIRLGEFEMKISQQPRGYCAYCCRLIKPAKYVRLYFTSKGNGGNTIELKMNKKLGALRSAGIDRNSPTVIFIHGFTEYGLGPAPRTIRDAYMSRNETYNIILVDWGDLTPLPWYPQSIQNSKMVASMIAKFIKFYNDTGELPVSNIHLVGFSLGAHLAGMIGKYFQSPQKLPRITGLDPAMPLFLNIDTSHKLTKEDAEFVDVIHTDAGKLGFPKSIGHADFYPNGGTFMQPGCDTSRLAQRRQIEYFVSCDHLRAWQFYAESVKNPTAFPATKCGIMKEGSFKECRFTTDAYMGFLADKNTTSGDFYLSTNDQKPFAKSAKTQEADAKAINLIL